MKAHMQDTSIAAYRSIQHQLNHKQQKVLNALKVLGVATNEEIAAHLHVGVHTVSPRTGELIAKKIIYRGEKVKTKSGREAYKFHIVATPVQLQLL